MTLNKIDINTAIADAENLLKKDQQVTAPIRAVMSVLLLVIKLLMAKNGMSSKNSSIPPSQDQNRKLLIRHPFDLTPNARSCGRLVATKERKSVPTACIC
ncbi:hypothetical protein MO867_15970 [Microbulbifer sp. OS29]|uniref:Uncharacterized protein n=1 Tax=Microbulbifer okhotskensis TaxID=2926617 RepID=A0A9X2J5R7_9GAMM|nr:hypothetical protein [Microbulbifer okhotskensis]MCO1335832.1 hypothetical protein [Microbulbifer okhotskensis]